MIPSNAPGVSESIEILVSAGAIPAQEGQRYLANHKRLTAEVETNTALARGTWVAAVDGRILTDKTLDGLTKQLERVRHGERACMTCVGGV